MRTLQPPPGLVVVICSYTAPELRVTRRILVFHGVVAGTRLLYIDETPLFQTVAHLCHLSSVHYTWETISIRSVSEEKHEDFVSMYLANNALKGVVTIALLPESLISLVDGMKLYVNFEGKRSITLEVPNDTSKQVVCDKIAEALGFDTGTFPSRYDIRVTAAADGKAAAETEEFSVEVVERSSDVEAPRDAAIGGMGAGSTTDDIAVTFSAPFDPKLSIGGKFTGSLPVSTPAMQVWQLLADRIGAAAENYYLVADGEGGRDLIVIDKSTETPLRELLPGTLSEELLLHMVDRRSLPEPEKAVFIKALTGSLTKVPIDVFKDSVLDLKVACAKYDGTPVERQRYVFRGKQLEDDRKLHVYEVTVGSVINMLLKLTGD